MFYSNNILKLNSKKNWEMIRMINYLPRITSCQQQPKNIVQGYFELEENSLWKCLLVCVFTQLFFVCFYDNCFHDRSVAATLFKSKFITLKTLRNNISWLKRKSTVWNLTSKKYEDSQDNPWITYEIE